MDLLEPNHRVLGIGVWVIARAYRSDLRSSLFTSKENVLAESTEYSETIRRYGSLSPSISVAHSSIATPWRTL